MSLIKKPSQAKTCTYVQTRGSLLFSSQFSSVSPFARLGNYGGDAISTSTSLESTRL